MVYPLRCCLNDASISWICVEHSKSPFSNRGIGGVGGSDVVNASSCDRVKSAISCVLLVQQIRMFDVPRLTTAGNAHRNHAIYFNNRASITGLMTLQRFE